MFFLSLWGSHNPAICSCSADRCHECEHWNATELKPVNSDLWPEVDALHHSKTIVAQHRKMSQRIPPPKHSRHIPAGKTISSALWNSQAVICVEYLPCSATTGVQCNSNLLHNAVCLVTRKDLGNCQRSSYCMVMKSIYCIFDNDETNNLGLGNHGPASFSPHLTTRDFDNRWSTQIQCPELACNRTNLAGSYLIRLVLTWVCDRPLSFMLSVSDHCGLVWKWRGYRVAAVLRMAERFGIAGEGLER
jgi:hypothetical protein